MDTLTSLTITEGIGYSMGVYFGLDLLMTLYNITNHTGPGGCAEEDWHTIGLLSWYLKQACDEGSSDDDCSDLGRWRKYASKKDGKPLTHLCHDQINKVYEDAVEHHIVKGYNNTQLIAYIIVPAITVLGIMYGLLATTTMNKGEWTFWIMIATIIFTSLSSITYNTDTSLIPTHENPLEYVTSK